MEDRAVCMPDALPGFTNISLFGVFDGHEGSEAAQHAAQAVAPALADAIHATWSPGRPLDQQELQSAVVQALHTVETSFADRAKQHDWEAGSTVVLVLLANSSLLTAHVGDSRAVICQAPWAVQEAEMAADECAVQTPLKGTDRAPECSEPGVPQLGLAAAGHAPTQPAAVRELTEDHSPDMPGEAVRIAAAGGFVTPGGPDGCVRPLP
eukprot:jgi/Astpho2/100/Aster-x0005